MRSLQIYYPDVNGILQMQLSTSGAEVASPIQTLLNKITKCLLTKPGSNLYVETGSVLGDKALIARMGNDLDKIRYLVNDAISGVERSILAEQALATNVVDDESALSSLTLSDIFRDEKDQTVIYVEVVVKTKNNNNYYLTV